MAIEGTVAGGIVAGLLRSFTRSVRPDHPDEQWVRGQLELICAAEAASTDLAREAALALASGTLEGPDVPRLQALAERWRAACAAAEQRSNE